jgi:RimJ/RimL family protein N-acetyltransferase
MGPFIRTARLTIVPATADIARAAVTDRVRFAALLCATVTEQWPPEVLSDVEEYFASQIEANPGTFGMYCWYIIAEPGELVSTRTLIGSIGTFPPGDDGVCMFGYAVLPDFEGRGVGREAARAFVAWLGARPEVRGIRADSFEGNTASGRILTGCGLSCIGVSPDDASAPDSDRKGRGRLLRYERRVGEG